MRRPFLSFLLMLMLFPLAVTAASRNPSNYVSAQNYSTMQPFMSNRMQNALDPGASQFTQSPSTVFSRTLSNGGIASVSDYATRTQGGTGGGTAARAATTGGGGTAMISPSARTAPNLAPGTGASGARRVVTRAASPGGGASSSARSAVGIGGAGSAARSGTVSAAGAPNSSARRVIARSGTISGGGRSGASARGTVRGDNSTYNQMVRSAMGISQSVAPDNSGVTSERCLADYTRCMDSYCHRENMLFDRCYCSSRLAQIDATYQKPLNDLTEKILVAQGGGDMTRDELEEYWDDTFGVHTGNNSLATLWSALDIDWADSESRVRGQGAFATGHEFCMQHTQACYYMAEELRGIYRSTIARDCKAYETYLDRLKTAAETILEQLTGGT